MFKCKVVVLYTNDKLDCLWNYGWLDWYGLDTDDLECMLKEYGESEEKNLKEIVDDSITVKHTIVVECLDTTEGRYLCNSCECYFDKLDDAEFPQCPFCGKDNMTDTEA